EDVSGGGPEENVAALQALLAGERVGPRSAALANAGAVVYLAGLAGSLREGVARCEQALDSGAARRLLGSWAD
ncbi:MAG TPA: anthranilate phosphoribosyltransferase, partial [candidate division Zixibacteria bacterium]|nr:anthranilate phosphoribosyltransferase [candidate division Zixibacteria bacterium]